METHLNNTVMSIAKQFNHDFSKGAFELFDQNGNQVYREDSSGYWVKQKFDQKGNQVYYEDSIGYWAKREYDQDGNQVYREDSSGYWVKQKFDQRATEFILSPRMVIGPNKNLIRIII